MPQTPFSGTISVRQALANTIHQTEKRINQMGDTIDQMWDSETAQKLRATIIGFAEDVQRKIQAATVAFQNPTETPL